MKIFFFGFQLNTNTQAGCTQSTLYNKNNQLFTPENEKNKRLKKETYIEPHTKYIILPYT